MKGIENRKAEDIKLVNTQMHLIKAPNAKEKITRMETSSEEEEDMDVSLSRLEEEAEKEKKPDPKKKSSVRAKQKLMLKA
ncbi:putative 60s ribosomal protein L24 [Fasciola gigantica]|uniref:Putative 60s ribosomal protein L24 n=1 Tax=Fasciola gigantica TaxID=46835 RepID=A0A504Z9J9_FASGI|nr:putative 60s ribosomal protein L24 [Fasciola gigantica]